MSIISKETEQQAVVFSALADPTRLELVKLLCHQSHPDALCVNALSGRLGMSQSAISQHLRVLKATGLVKGERRGNHIHYCINPDMEKNYHELLRIILGADKALPEQICQNYCQERSKQHVS